jgi:hypothetical protein
MYPAVMLVREVFQSKPPLYGHKGSRPLALYDTNGNALRVQHAIELGVGHSGRAMVTSTFTLGLLVAYVGIPG